MNDVGSNVRPGQPLAVVVGAGGLSMAIARRLGDTYRILISDIDRHRLHGQVAALRSEGHDAAGVPCDVAVAQAVRAMADVARAAGPVRALVYVLGLSPSMADATTIMRVHLLGPTLVADAFLELMTPGAAAVFIAFMAGHLGEVSPAVLDRLD